ncbi:hypothetical protein [Klebsiella grimontii]|uniref:hypothetical protein n=1 Tax=Klebsiella grimontii TaxID=2058152 RepID=UPI001915BEF6|nr:hypothetical protein [Klebsiella grimontii]QQQ25739.1 hypothetical protein JIZ39_27855 [Klebsiella grimontii]
MALTPDELIAISDLEKAQITDSAVVPDWVLPAEVRGSSAPINGDARRDKCASKCAII